jgi:predicted DNA-binding transcriptional regulator YafY
MVSVRAFILFSTNKLYNIIKNLIYLANILTVRMNEQRKILRVFQLLARLRGPFGCLKEDVARDFWVSTRTIERYFELLSDLGFDIVRQGKAFRIPPRMRSDFDAEDLFVFSPEEAAIIRGALLSCSSAGPLQKTILEKLYALTDLDELSETLYKQSVATNISLIITAIRERRQVILKSYHSINQRTATDRLVEPIRFYYYYRYLLAYEPATSKVKQFKTERIGCVDIKELVSEHGT